MRPGAPQRRRSDTRGRGNEFADGLEKLTDEALGRPVCHPDLSAFTADAHEFAGGQLLIWREHHSKGGKHNIEAGIFEGKRLRVGLLKHDGKALCFCTLAAALKKRNDIVGRYYI